MDLNVANRTFSQITLEHEYPVLGPTSENASGNLQLLHAIRSWKSKKIKETTFETINHEEGRVLMGEYEIVKLLKEGNRIIIPSFRITTKSIMLNRRLATLGIPISSGSYYFFFVGDIPCCKIIYQKLPTGNLFRFSSTDAVVVEEEGLDLLAIARLIMPRSFSYLGTYSSERGLVEVLETAKKVGYSYIYSNRTTLDSWTEYIFKPPSQEQMDLFPELLV